ncbi:MAG TPA: DMT family transporter [Pirellulales bacterium]|jgi:drug/metabolite transporter (DMT)-like permease|nr:DMT family transporter [Pirellulales bacterium]
MHDGPDRSSRWGLLEVHAAVALFGLTALFGKFLLLAPFTIVLGRTATAAVALGAYLLLWRRRELGWRWRAVPLLLVSGLLLGLHWATFFQAVQVSTVAIALLTYSSFPLFVALLEPLLYRERFRAFDLATALLVLGGLALIVPRFDTANSVTQGAGWGVLSGLLFAALSLLNRTLIQTHAAALLSFVQITVAAVVCLPLGIWFAGETFPSARDCGLLVVLGVVCTALPHTLFNMALAHIRAGTAAVIVTLESVYGIVFAYALLQERPAPRTLLGGAVLLFAVLLATLFRAAPLRAKPSAPLFHEEV